VLALAGAAVWLVTGTTLVATSGGCYNHACDNGFIVDFATKRTDDAGNRVDDVFCGEFLAPDLWETSPADADWIDFPPKSAIVLKVPAWIGENRPFVELHAYVSQQRHPVCSGAGCDPANNFTEGTGNIVEFSRAQPGVVWVTNDTCAQFYLRAVLRAGAPRAPTSYDAATWTPGPLGPPVGSCEKQ
jgi:hypothetical protein